jgi:hypothetical protein
MQPPRRVRRQLRALARRAAALSALSASLFSANARADAPNFSFGAGVFVGYNFGPRAGVEYGFEGFATHRFSEAECSDRPRMGVGPLLQLAVVGSGDPRVTLAAQGGGEFTRSLAALSGERGVTYRFDDRPGFGIHTGIVPSSLFFNTAFRYQWLLQDAWVGGGVRFLPTYGDLSVCSVVAGRPLRTDSGMASIRAATRLAPDFTRSRHSVAAVGEAWERDAQLECASILAFLQLAEQLAVLDAPPALVARALDGARDEIRHTQLCATLASRHLRQRVQPTLPHVEARRCKYGRAALVRLATESWLDGCVAEGIAARHATLAAELATDADARRVQQHIAVDEARHAELGWATLTWALERGGDEVRAAVCALRAVAPHEVSPTGLHDDVPDDLARYGRLNMHTVNTLARQHLDESRQRLDRLVA